VYNKREIIKDIISQRDTLCFNTFYKLFECLLDECRIENDTAPISEVPKIQGKIELLKGFLKDLNPQPLKRKFDGGYGE